MTIKEATLKSLDDIRYLGYVNDWADKYKRHLGISER